MIKNTIQLFIAIGILFFAFDINAQKIEVEELKAMKIRNIGPAGMSGRVTSIDVVESNTDIIYAGTASGGVWRSTSGGIDWKPIFDKQPLTSVGALAIQQSNPDVIWVGTGEGNPRNSFNSGEGIFKSINGGRTWTRMGLEKTRSIHRIIIDKTNPDVVYVAAVGSAWGANKERGVFKTTNGGETWEKVLYVNDQTGCADLIIDPTNPNKLVAAMWEHWRKPWFFNSGGKGSGLYVTYDGGKNWEKRTSKDGLPKGDLGRIGLAVAPSKPNIIYALVEAKINGLYKSTDGGVKWKLVSEKNIGNRPFYYADIFVDPNNENRIFNLYSLVSKSEDGGKSFDVILEYGGGGVHPDHHAFWIDPNNPAFMIDGNDGGLNISRDGGDTWRFIENLPLAQYYHIGIDMEVPYNIYGGMQDNGTWIGPSEVWKAGGIRNNDFQEVFFGDGFDCMPRRDNSRYGYAMSQGGNLGYFDRVSGTSEYIKPVHPDDVELRFNWNAALAQNPYHDCGIYYGSQFVHKSMDCGKSWEIISPDLTTNDPEKQKQLESGGLTIDATRAENYTTILAIAPSPVDENVIWVGTDDGNLQLTIDGGKNWKNLADRLPSCPKGAWIPYIEVSKKNKGEVYVIVNDYRRNNFKPYAYKSTDMGETWTQIADSKKVKGHTLAIVQDPEAPNLLFLGTDYGLYFTIDGGDNWNKWDNDYPSVPTRDLKIHPRELDLVVGTFGRAAWVLDDIRPLREMAQTNGKVLNQDFRLFDAPPTYLHDFRSYDGVRFTADGHFIGENAAQGALLTVWLKKKKKEDKSKVGTEGKSKNGKVKKTIEKVLKAEVKKEKGEKKSKKATIEVYNANGDKVRTFTRKLKGGLNRFTWNLRQDGIRYPSYREPKKGSDSPSGNEVFPGKYKIVMTFGKHKDSTIVDVILDPNLNVSVADMNAKAAIMTEMETTVTKAKKAFDNLKTAKKTIKLVDAQIVNAPDSTQKEIKNSGKAMKDSLDSLMALFTNPPNKKGIQRAPNTLNGKISAAMYHLGSSVGKPGGNAINAKKNAEAHTKEVLEKVNAFFETDWNDYKKKVESIQYSLFKEMKTID